MADRKSLFWSILILAIYSLIPTLGLPTQVLTNSSGEKENEFDHFRESKQFPEKCKAGTVYKISEPADFLKYESELECVFDGAVAPSKVPEGTLFGKVIIVGDSHELTPIVTYVWKGKHTEKVKCNGVDSYVGWNHILSVPHIPFLATVGPIRGCTNLHPMEYDNDKDTLIFDYTIDIICPYFNETEERRKERLIIQKPAWRRNYFPLDLILDVLRLAGKQADGGNILLGKVIMRDIFEEGHPAAGYAYFYIVNYDPDLNPEFHIGDSLPPLEKDFYYRKNGYLDFLKLFPFDNLFTGPITATSNIAHETVRSARAFANFLMDHWWGTPKETENFGKLFESYIANNFSNSQNELNNPLASYLLSEGANHHSHSNEL